ncbi:MAG TPA: hypothetical protein VJ824_12055 [Bacillota bacterium]|nr:hypothetical protein [Bacillota bacterium]
MSEKDLPELIELSPQAYLREGKEFISLVDHATYHSLLVDKASKRWIEQAKHAVRAFYSVK